MVSAKNLFLIASAAALAQARDWDLGISWYGGPAPWSTHGWTNSGCKSVPNYGYWIKGFNFRNNQFTDTIKFYSSFDCSGKSYKYKAGSQTFSDGKMGFNSFEIY